MNCINNFLKFVSQFSEKQRRVPDLIIANNVVSDPYQHMIKDFGAPENIPPSTRLDEPRDAAKEKDWDVMNFFRVFEDLQPKNK